jgi:CHAD domain-containing protein
VIARTTRPIVGDALVPLQDGLRWLAGVLGPVRDLDVLLEHLGPQVETLDDDVDGAKLLEAALKRQRLFRVAEAKEALASERYDLILAQLDGARAAVPKSDDPLAPLVNRELARLRRVAANLDGAHSDPEIHALRIRAKRARYTAELLDGAKWQRLGRALSRVQDLAGAHQDAVRAEEQLRGLSRPKTAVAVGRLIERERFRKGAQRAALPAALAKALR